jgi:DNA-binding YbaB/EbfC family protein
MLPSGWQRWLGGQLFAQLQQAQQEVERLCSLRLEGQAGGGQVRAVVSGLGELLEVHLDPQLLKPEERETLQDLIVVAVREAMGKAEEAQRERLQEMLRQLPLGNLLGR